MPNNAYPYGFRIVGTCQNERRSIDWPSAFLAYSQCDERAEVTRESYLSAFCFTTDFHDYLTATGSTKGYAGDCWSPWLWFDIDADDIDTATTDARRLASIMLDRFGVAGDEMLIFYSGSKGYHFGLPTSLWMPEPSRLFNAYCRQFAETVAALSNVAIDSGVYDRVRAFRAPNSRHAKTGRHKRILTLDELMGLKASRIVELANEPEPFELPESPRPCGDAICQWQAAVAFVDAQSTVAKERRASGGTPTITRSTRTFIRDGAEPKHRHRLLFSAAANLAEFGCTLELATALLSEPALDSGLSPSEVRRQIECGWNHREGTQ